jgi:uncharacterized protein
MIADARTYFKNRNHRRVQRGRGSLFSSRAPEQAGILIFMLRTTAASSLQPLLPDQRIAAIDIVRGISIFGVLASDMIGLSSPDHHFAPSLLWTDPVSRATAFMLDVLVSEKFITLFSVLFGIGFAIQMERATRCSAKFANFYLRRLAALCCMGIVHGLFFWAGDILTTYAALGLLLLLFRRRSQKAVIGWAIGLQMFMFVVSLAAWLLGNRQSGVPGLTENRLLLYGQGTWEAIQRARVHEFIDRHVWSLPLMLVFVFPRFLLGLWLWRTEFLKNLSSHKRLLLWMCVGGIAIGFIGEAATALLRLGDMSPLRAVCVPVLACGYACGLTLFNWSNWLPPIRDALAAVGRTALSNYLFQRVLCTTLFYSYGFGLYGKVDPLAGLGLTILIFAAQMLLSACWMRRFQYGPLEWVWRSFSYWELQPVSARTAAAA